MYSFMFFACCLIALYVQFFYHSTNYYGYMMNVHLYVSNYNITYKPIMTNIAKIHISILQPDKKCSNLT